MSWLQQIPALIESCLAAEISQRQELPLASTSPQNQDNEFALSIVEDFHLGGIAIDMPTRIVLTNWQDALENNRPTVSEATSSGELDFWAQYDAVKDNFVTHILNRTIPNDPKIANRTTDTSIDVIYEDLITTATFHANKIEDTPELLAAEKLLFDIDDNGVSTETKGYLQFIELARTFFNAEIAIEELADNASKSRKALLINKRDHALTQLNVIGRRIEYENAETIINQHVSLENTEDERTELIARYESALIDSIAEPGRLYPSTSIAESGILNRKISDSIWQTIEITGDALKADDKTLLALGLSKKDIEEAAKNIHAIRAAYRLINIHRNWLDFSFFRKKYWTHTDTVSDGVGGGSLPTIADGLIIMPFFEITQLKFVIENKASSDSVRKTKASSMRHPDIKSMTMKKIDPVRVEKIKKFQKLAAKQGLAMMKPMALQVKPKKNVSQLQAVHSSPKLFQKHLQKMEFVNIERQVPKLQPKPALIAKKAFNPNIFITPVESVSRPTSQASGRITIVLDEQASITDVEIFIASDGENLIADMTKGSNSKPKKPLFLKTAQNKQLILDDIKQKLTPGQYKLIVNYKNQEKYSEAFNIVANKPGFSFDLQVTIAEEQLIGNAPVDGADENFLIPIFGYRIRRVPPCPEK